MNIKNVEGTARRTEGQKMSSPEEGINDVIGKLLGLRRTENVKAESRTLIGET